MDKKKENKNKFKIDEYGKKKIEKYVYEIDEMFNRNSKTTIKNVFKYLWSLIALGINWIVYRKIFIVLLTVVVLVGSMVLSHVLGIILCLLTPIFLAIYGRYFYLDITKEYENLEKNKQIKFLIPSSLLIVWILIILVIILIII